MAAEFDIEALLARFSPEKVQKDSQSGAYTIKDFSQKGRDQRNLFVQQLFDQFPIRLIWLKDLNEQVRNTLGSPLSTAGGAGIWKLPSAITSAGLLDGLREGVWAIFFFPNSLQNVPPPPELLPMVPEEVIPILSKFVARVAILSWYDDTEWLIVSSPRHD